MKQVNSMEINNTISQEYIKILENRYNLSIDSFHRTAEARNKISLLNPEFGEDLFSYFELYNANIAGFISQILHRKTIKADSKYFKQLESNPIINNSELMQILLKPEFNKLLEECLQIDYSRLLLLKYLNFYNPETAALFN